MRWFSASAAALAVTLPAASFSLEIQEIESPGGIKAWLVEDHTIPFTAMQIYFRGGAVLEPEDKLGAAYLMTGLLEEGAGTHDAAEFQKRQQELAADFSYDAYSETLSVGVRFLTEDRDRSIELLRLSLEEPRFDLDRVEFVRGQVLSILADHEKDPAEIGSRTVDRLTYGDHPFARPIEGTVETVKALTPEDLENTRQKLFSRSNVIVGAAGDISAAELGELLDNLLGGLPDEARTPVEKPEFLLDAGVTVVDYPSPQSIVLFIHEGILRNDPDFLAAYVLTEIIGSGSFGSRLHTEVREKRGLTYGIGAYLGAHSNSGFIAGDFATANETAAEAVSVVQAEWERLVRDGVSEDELQRFKTHLTGAYPLRFDGNSRIARILAHMQFDNLPASYVKNRNDMVNALTVEEMNRVAKRLIRPEKLHFVVVGQPVGLEGESAD